MLVLQVFDLPGLFTNPDEVTDSALELTPMRVPVAAERRNALIPIFVPHAWPHACIVTSLVSLEGLTVCRILLSRCFYIFFASHQAAS